MIKVHGRLRLAHRQTFLSLLKLYVSAMPFNVYLRCIQVKVHFLAPSDSLDRLKLVSKHTRIESSIHKLFVSFKHLSQGRSFLLILCFVLRHVKLGQGHVLVETVSIHADTYQARADYVLVD